VVLATFAGADPAQCAAACCNHTGCRSWSLNATHATDAADATDAAAAVPPAGGSDCTLLQGYSAPFADASATSGVVYRSGWAGGSNPQPGQ